MNEKLLGIGEASSHEQQNRFHQTIHQSLPDQPKSTNPHQNLSSHSSFWPDHSIPSSPCWIWAPNPPWRDWHWEMDWEGHLGGTEPKQNPRAVLKGKKGMGMAEDEAVWSDSLRANQWPPATPNFAAFPWQVNILHQDVVLLFQLLRAPNTRDFPPYHKVFPSLPTLLCFLLACHCCRTFTVQCHQLQLQNQIKKDWSKHSFGELDHWRRLLAQCKLLHPDCLTTHLKRENIFNTRLKPGWAQAPHASSDWSTEESLSSLQVLIPACQTKPARWSSCSGDQNHTVSFGDWDLHSAPFEVSRNFGIYLTDEGWDPKVFVQHFWKDASLNKINWSTF